MLCRHQVQAGVRQGHAHARADSSDRECFVYVPQTAPWLAEYLHQMAVFPKGKHDDQVDSTAQFLDWLKKPMKGWNIFELYRQRAEALAAAERGEEVQPLENQLPDLMEIYRRTRQGYDSGQNTR